jgi:hypothetical protein
MPGWVRRYAADPRAPWWPPVLGVAVGGSAGFFLPGPGLPNSPGTLILGANWAAGPLLLLSLAGIAVLLVGLAHGVDPYRRKDLVAATVAAAGVAAATVPAPVDALTAWAGGLAPTFVRTAILFGTALSDAEPIIVFAAVALFAVIAARSAPRPRPAPRRLGGLLTAVTVVAVATGIAVTMLRLSPDGDRVVDLPLVWHRWWVSALAGGVVLVVLLARSPVGRPLSQRLSGALTAAAGVTTVAAVAQFVARVVATGWDPAYHPGLLGQYLTVPLRLLLLLSVVAAPVALAVAAVAARWPESKRAVPVRLRTPLATATAVVLCAAVMFGMGETVTGGVADARRIAQSTPSSSASPTIPPSAPPPTPAVLTAARARQAVAAAGTQLPGWSENPALTEDSEESSCAARLDAPPPAEPDVKAAMAYSADAKRQPPAGAHILVTVESYRRKPDAEDVFAPMRREVEACRSYTEPSADNVDGRSHVRLSLRNPGSVGHPAFGFGLVRTDRVTQKLAGVTTAHAVTVVAGHHVVSVAVVYSHIGEPPEHRMAVLDGTADRVLDEVMRQVGR